HCIHLVLFVSGMVGWLLHLKFRGNKKDVRRNSTNVFSKSLNELPPGRGCNRTVTLLCRTTGLRLQTLSPRRHLRPCARKACLLLFQTDTSQPLRNRKGCYRILCEE